MSDSSKQWRQVDVAGVECWTYEPARPNRHGYAVLFLHDSSGRVPRDSAAFAAELDRLGLRLLAPMTGRSWWTDRGHAGLKNGVSAERLLLDALVPFAIDRWESRPPRLALIGEEMGGQGALRLAFRHPDTFPIAAAVSPAIDYQLAWESGDEGLRRMYPSAEAARQDTAILRIHPLYWPRNIWFTADRAGGMWFDSCERLHMKLSALGIPHEYCGSEDAGLASVSKASEPLVRAVRFAAERLEKERLRVS